MATSGTKQEYVVDVWSGNHPFYLGNRFGVLVDADRVEKFRKKLWADAILECRLLVLNFGLVAGFIAE
ncbi:hypothetical protein NC653_014739 [Populus alba x Populus x berolinensis]|uniref:Large ribosomal subunit protein bL31c n=1 Tax=Populus alba x Populus x berolinensis TaxID=444605 RepID=A0AAD6QXT4_9ROSI|nr:hypothetical protein NC653_014739 [Populus alba x Populus x berolinensis]